MNLKVISQKRVLSSKNVSIFVLALISIPLIYYFMTLEAKITLSWYTLVVSGILVILFAGMKLYYPTFEANFPAIKESRSTTIFIVYLFNLAISILIFYFLTPVIRDSLLDLIHAGVLSKSLITFIDPFFQMIVNGVLFFCIYYILKRKEQFIFRDLDMNWKNFLGGFKWTFIIWGIILIFKLSINFFEGKPILLPNGSNFFLSLLDFIIYLFFVGISEEVTYRSFIFNQSFIKFQKRNIDNRIAIAFAIIVSSTLFSLIHLPHDLTNIGNIPSLRLCIPLLNRFFLGVIFSVFYLATGNVFLVSGIHGLMDFDNENAVLYMVIMLVIILFQKSRKTRDVLDSL